MTAEPLHHVFGSGRHASVRQSALHRADHRRGRVKHKRPKGAIEPLLVEPRAGSSRRCQALSGQQPKLSEYGVETFIVLKVEQIQPEDAFLGEIPIQKGIEELQLTAIRQRRPLNPFYRAVVEGLSCESVRQVGL